MADEAAPMPATFGPPPDHPFVDDPGGVFATDAHRRVLGHLPTPDQQRMSPAELYGRIASDQGNPLIEVEEIERLVSQLAEQGLVATENGLRMTDDGLEAIQR
jgi:hypothetical protein